jgi:dipeptidyl aminopeptidase/acylaminoacyl peptidase
MLGTLDGAGDPEDEDPVNRQSAKVQCVVARAAPVDLVARAHRASVVSFMGMRLPQNTEKSSKEMQLFREASPVNHVSNDDPPFLLIHGDKDSTVPYEQSEMMEKVLRSAGVEVTLLRIPGGLHGPTFGNVGGAPDYLAEMVDWLNKHLLINEHKVVPPKE